MQAHTYFQEVCNSCQFVYMHHRLLYQDHCTLPQDFQAPMLHLHVFFSTYMPILSINMDTILCAMVVAYPTFIIKLVAITFH